MEKYILAPILLLASSIWADAIWEGLKKGETAIFKKHSRTAYRKTNPGEFWLTIILRTIMAIACCVGAIGFIEGWK